MAPFPVPSRRSPASASASRSSASPLEALLADMQAPSARANARALSHPSAAVRRLSRSTDGGVHPPPSLPSTRSAPAVGSEFRGGNRGNIRGYITEGEEYLFHYTSDNAGWICGAYIGGKSGSRTRFCCRRKQARDDKHCGLERHGGDDRFILHLNYLYIPMQDQTALCEPCVSADELEKRGMARFFRDKFNSRRWLEVITAFLAESADAFDTESVHSAGGHEDGSLAHGSDQDTSRRTRPPLNVSVKHEENEDEHYGLGDGTESLGSRPWYYKSFFDHIIPPSTSSFEEIYNEDAGWLGPLSEARDALSSVQQNVAGLLEAVPEAMNKLDRQVEQKLALRDKKLREIEDSLELIQGDLFGNGKPSRFLDQNQSFADAYINLAATVDAVKSIVDSTQAHCLSLVDKVADAEAIAKMAAGSLDDVVDKVVEVIKVSIDRAKGVEESLANRLSQLELHPSPDVADSHTLASQRSGATALLDALLEANRPRAVQTSHPAPVQASSVVSASRSTDGLANVIDSDTAGQLLEVLKSQGDKIKKLEELVSSLRDGDLSSGVSVDTSSFESEDDIVELLKAEKVPPTAYGMAVDAVSFFAHHLSGHTSAKDNTDELKALKSAGITDAVCNRYVGSFRQMHPPYFLDSKGTVVSVGDRFPLLDSKDAWEGTASFKGGKDKLLKALQDAAKKANTYIIQKVPEGSIRDLCKILVTRTADWYSRLISHIDQELLTIRQYGIPEEATFTMVCDELQLIFEAIWAKRMCMQEFSAEQDDILFMARGIFTTMQAHMIMDDFAEPGFATHVLITSLFVRFLAKQTGENFSSGLQRTLDDIRKDVATNKRNQDTINKAVTGRLDNHTENIKALCTKTTVSYKPFKGRQDV